jgi:hypothetical protein
MMGCKKCGCQYEAPIPHCTTCTRDLSKAGLCVSCGEKPSEHGPDPTGRLKSKCIKCKHEWTARRIAKDAEVKTEYGPPKYRGPDHRERTHETKHGSGHG